MFIKIFNSILTIEFISIIFISHKGRRQGVKSVWKSRLINPLEALELTQAVRPFMGSIFIYFEVF